MPSRRICHFHTGLVFLLMVAANAAHAEEDAWSLDDGKKRSVDALFAEWDTEDSPGAAIGISRRGTLIFAREYGCANLDHLVPIRPDSVFYMASTSKQFTAAAIAILSLDGTIDLDDSIRKWLPEFPDSASNITIRHLIHHTSGIRDYGQLMFMQGRTFNQYFDNDGTVKLLSRQKAGNFPPGTQFRYCNSNYVLLAEIVERASGKTCEAFTHKRIFLPLGMNRTRWGRLPRQVVRKKVLSYLQIGDSPELFRFDVNFSGYGDGNLWTTVEDMARWDRNFYEPAVGGGDLVRLLLTKGRLLNGASLDYAFGLSHGMHKGLPSISHGGQLFGYGSEVLRFPGRGLCVIVFTNLRSIDVSENAKQIADIVLDLPHSMVRDAVHDATTHGSDDTLFLFTGEYYDAPTGRVVSVSCDTGMLTLHGLRESVSMHRTGACQFQAGDIGTEVMFDVGGGEPAREMVLKSSTSVESMRLPRLERSQVDARTLASFAGCYRSDELRTNWIVEPSNSRLTIRWKNRMLHLVSLDDDRFESEVLDVTFRRDTAGNIDGLSVYSEAVSGLFFRRSANARRSENVR